MLLLSIFAPAQLLCVCLPVAMRRVSLCLAAAVLLPHEEALERGDHLFLSEQCPDHVSPSVDCRNQPSDSHLPDDKRLARGYFVNCLVNCLWI